MELLIAPEAENTVPLTRKIPTAARGNDTVKADENFKLSAEISLGLNDAEAYLLNWSEERNSTKRRSPSVD